MKMSSVKDLSNCGSKSVRYSGGQDSQDHDTSASPKFRPKIFAARRSLLSQFYEQSNDARALFCLALAAYFLLLIRMLLIDYANTGNLFSHLWLIKWNFHYFTETMIVWSVMALSILIPYYILKFWSSLPSKHTQLSREFSLFFSLILYYIVLFVCSIRFVYKMGLNPACSFIITCENTRIFMKVHSFIRETIPKAIHLKTLNSDEKLSKNDVDDEIRYPTINQLYYYFFCPSLIYRDSYPLTAKRSWKMVSLYFIQFVAIVHLVDIIFVQFIYPQFHDLKYANLTMLDVIQSIFTNFPYGFVCLLAIFYGLLHCWLNMFSEMLYFADRHFYANWWSSNNMAVYYRNWNLVVHDWLYAYVYKDITSLLGGKAAATKAQVLVFFLSSTVHEYWFGVALRVFYPLIFILYFVFGGIYFIVSRNIQNNFVWNALMWINLFIGTGTFMALYSQEWFARCQCAPVLTNSLWDIFLPRHWFCREML